MANRLDLLLIVLVAAALFIQSSKAQTSHVVGDSGGWAVPSGPSVYSTWAATQTFAVGDMLVFNYATGAHDVARVPAAAYNACNTTNTLSVNSTGPTIITLSSTDEYYFICTVGNHCDSGQKLAINVTAGSGSSPSPSGSSTPPPPPSPPPPPPPPSSAPSFVRGAALPAALLSIAVALFY